MTEDIFNALFSESSDEGKFSEMLRGINDAAKRELDTGTHMHPASEKSRGVNAPSKPLLNTNGLQFRFFDV